MVWRFLALRTNRNLPPAPSAFSNRDASVEFFRTDSMPFIALALDV